MFLYNVFDTESEANTAQSYDLSKHLAYHQSINASVAWINATKYWEKPIQRATDNKWVYKVCAESDKIYTVEPLDTGGEWFPVEGGL